MHNYTSKYLRQNTVELLTEKVLFGKKVEKVFVARFQKSVVAFSVPAEIIKVLGRLFKNNDNLELGYLVKKDIWFILQKDKLLWSNKVIKLDKKEENEKVKFNRFTALTKKMFEV